MCFSFAPYSGFIISPKENFGYFALTASNPEMIAQSVCACSFSFGSLHVGRSAKRQRSASPEASMKNLPLMRRSPALSATTAAATCPGLSHSAAARRVCRNGVMRGLRATYSSSRIWSPATLSVAPRAGLSLRSSMRASPRRTSSRSISSVSPPMIFVLPSEEYSVCHIGTSPCVAVPPKPPDISTSATLHPASAARIAANTPVQLPPITTTSNSPASACRATAGASPCAPSAAPAAPIAIPPRNSFLVMLPFQPFQTRILYHKLHDQPTAIRLELTSVHSIGRFSPL